MQHEQPASTLFSPAYHGLGELSENCSDADAGAENELASEVRLCLPPSWRLLRLPKALAKERRCLLPIRGPARREPRAEVSGPAPPWGVALEQRPRLGKSHRTGKPQRRHTSFSVLVHARLAIEGNQGSGVGHSLPRIQARPGDVELPGSPATRVIPFWGEGCPNPPGMSTAKATIRLSWEARCRPRAIGGTTHQVVEISTGYPDGSEGSPAPEEEAS